MASTPRFTRYVDYYGTDKYQFKFENMEVVQVPEDAPRLALVRTGKADIANMSGPFAEEITRVRDWSWTDRAKWT